MSNVASIEIARQDHKAWQIKRQQGWVYIMSNPVLPEILKIGFTSGDPEARRAELSRSTSIPEPFKIEDGLRCAQGRKVEREVHKALSDCRVNDRREFFRCSVGEAMFAIWMADIGLDEDLESEFPEIISRITHLYGKPKGRSRLASVRGMPL